MDFDWPASGEDNQSNTSRVGEERLMNKLMYRFVATRKKKKKKGIDPFLDAVCPFKASCVKMGSASLFFFMVASNVHLSIINSFYMYQIQFSPRRDLFISYCPFCL